MSNRREVIEVNDNSMILDNCKNFIDNELFWQHLSTNEFNRLIATLSGQ